MDCLGIVQRDYEILSADKAKNTYVIHCKPWLAKQVLRETETTVTCTQATHANGTPMELQEIIDADWEFIEEEGLARKQPTPPPTPDPADPLAALGWRSTPVPEVLLFHQRVPTFGVVVKTIKDNKLRFLAKSHKTSLSQLSQWITKTKRSS